MPGLFITFQKLIDAAEENQNHRKHQMDVLKFNGIH